MREGVRSYFMGASFLSLCLLRQLTMNKIPIRNAGPAIIRIQDIIYHSNEFLSIFINIVTIYNIPAKIKATPPTISCFQDIIKTAKRINTGILCMNNPTAICQKLNSGEMTSNENNAKKHIKIIERILGVQYIYLFIFCSIALNVQPGSKCKRIKIIFQAFIRRRKIVSADKIIG